ncbi:MAG TPA: prepilin-type N-terminal cleavage/methylation domain-containing protein [Gemmatimonadaceae bacterium]|nr:prepilin-type N-terminal cleavage/methylation domain-containing protein [Gemmatimonadaceae bacterium]
MTPTNETTRPRRPRRGLTLIEMIIAIIIMSIGVMGLAGTASYVAAQMGGGNAQTIAAGLATKVSDSLSARRCAAIVDGSQTVRGVSVAWTVKDSTRTRWVTETVQYKPKRGPSKSLTYTVVIQCPD